MRVASLLNVLGRGWLLAERALQYIYELLTTWYFMEV